MKLCIHCVHYLDHPESKDPQHGLCEASPKTYSPVTGAIERDHEFCSSYRISTCGQKARFFEPILGLDVANELPDSKVFPIYTTPPQRTEPVCPECKAGVLYECVACSSNNYPPQRTWVGLTDEEMGFLFPHGKSEWVQETVKIIEAKLKEKNHV
jgi:hypothetical protein